MGKKLIRKTVGKHYFKLEEPGQYPDGWKLDDSGLSVSVKINGQDYWFQENGEIYTLTGRHKLEETGSGIYKCSVCGEEMTIWNPDGCSLRP